MNRWGYLLVALGLREPPAPVVVTRGDRLPDQRVTEILQAAPKEHLIYRAFMQLLEDERDEAIANIAEDATSATAMASHAGGARYLKVVLDDVLERRSRKKAATD